MQEPPPLVLVRTPRLVLRRFQAGDLEAFSAYRTDPEVARFQPWENFGHHAAEEFVRQQMRAIPDTRGEWFQVALALAESDDLIGDCAIRPLLDEPRIVELGFTLSRTHQGHGYATEAVRALLGYLFGTLRKHKVVAYADVRNDRSVRLLERVGLRREGFMRENYMVHGRWVDECFYAMLESDWERAPSEESSR